MYKCRENRELSWLKFNDRVLMQAKDSKVPLGEKLSFILEPLFGFKSAEAIAFPITSLGAVGAAMSLVPQFITDGIITPNDIAVFTAMGMCWSGYLSTHVGMMDALNARELTSKAILSHTIGGICAGVSAHFIFMIIS